jgi:hypothetical protein
VSVVYQSLLLPASLILLLQICALDKSGVGACSDGFDLMILINQSSNRVLCLRVIYGAHTYLHRLAPRVPRLNLRSR